MITEFGSLGRPVIYDPDEFEAFCRRAGATSIFFNMVSSFFNHRQSATRHQQNRKAAVAILYKLVFTLSQRCNFMQKENTLFMITNNLDKDAINTGRSLASACSSRTGNRMLQRGEEKNSKLLNLQFPKQLKMDGSSLPALMITQASTLTGEQRNHFQQEIWPPLL
eukprot:Seg789.2 transcript_id=Seg789.2/GoldUCD/mRNA.D3Y31 product="hypothetical protein" protein_id=Seg789.2/GoldUCD/D3Y31